MIYKHPLDHVLIGMKMKNDMCFFINESNMVSCATFFDS